MMPGYQRDQLFTAPGEIGAHGLNVGRLSGLEQTGSESRRGEDGIPIDPDYESSVIPEHCIRHYLQKMRHE